MHLLDLTPAFLVCSTIHRFAFLLVLAPIAFLPVPVKAANYNAAKEFQIAGNPGTPWSYGYSVEGLLGYSLVLFDKHVEDQAPATASRAWSMSNYNPSGTLGAWINSAQTVRY